MAEGATPLRTVGAGLACLGCMSGLALLSRAETLAILPYVALLCLGSGLISALLWRQQTLGVRALFAVTIGAHVIALLGIPRFEDDYFRFLWDGWRVLTHGSPYGAAPADFFGDPSIPPALQPILSGVNSPEVPTLYGPVLEGLFATAVGLFGLEERGVRGLLALANLALIWLLQRRHGSARAALYAWNPLMLAEIALHGHPDGVMALALVGGLEAAKAGRRILSGICFALAAGAKIVALAAWPALLRGGPKSVAAAVLALLALYLPFALQTPSVGFDGAGAFAAHWRFNAGVFDVFALATTEPVARGLSGALGLGLVLLAHRRDASLATMNGAAIFGAILLVAPVINAWYLAWVLPFALERQRYWPWAAACALPLSYLTGLNLNDADAAPFAVHPWARAAEVLIMIAALAADLQRARRPTAPRASSTKSESDFVGSDAQNL